MKTEKLMKLKEGRGYYSAPPHPKGGSNIRTGKGVRAAFISKVLSWAFLFSLLFFVLSSCKEKIIIIPGSVLDKDTMAAVMVDIQLLEAMKIRTKITDSLPQDSILMQYALVFNKHNLTQEQFEQSFDFYKSHPALLVEIYDKSINELSKMQAELGNINTLAVDSIKRNREVRMPHNLAGDAMILMKEEEKSKLKKQSIQNGKNIVHPVKEKKGK